MKKKVLSAILAVAVSATAFVGCGKTENKPSTGGNGTTQLKVGLVTDQGGVNDGSFNTSANRGVEKAEKDLGIKRLNPIESKSADAYEPNLKTMSSQADLTIGSGFMMMQAMDNVSKQSADKKFLLIDAVVKNPNVLSITFKEEEGSFLAGVMAGLTTKSNKIGFIGGKESEVIGRFEAGFVAGVASVNPEAAKGLLPKDATSHGSYVKYADSFDKQEVGEEAATMLYNQGVDIIFHAAGGVGLGVFKAAQKLNKYAIGVDSDQAVAESSKAYKDVILYSMEKKVDVAVFGAVKDLKDGNFKGGVEKKLGVKEEAVGIAPTINTAVPQAAKDKVEIAKKMINDGKITVPSAPKDLVDYKAVEVK